MNCDTVPVTNITVIMDAIEWASSNKLTGNATITSLYAGVDYKAQGAEWAGYNLRSLQSIQPTAPRWFWESAETE